MIESRWQGIWMRISLFVVIGWISSAWHAVGAPPISDELQSSVAYRKALELHHRGECEKGRQWIEHARESLPPRQGFSRWSVTKEQMPYVGAWCGTDAVYTMSADMTYGGNSRVWANLEPTVHEVLITGKYDCFRHFISCYELKTGALRWRLRVSGGFNLFICDQERRMYMHQTLRLAEIDTTNGNVLSEVPVQAVHSGEANSINALWVYGHLLPTLRPLPSNPAQPSSSMVVYDVEKKTVLHDSGYNLLKPSAWDLRFTEVIRSTFFRQGNVRSTLLCRLAGTPPSATLWNYECDDVGHPPFWHEGDVLALNGGRLGEVVRLRGNNGDLAWRYRLGAAPGQALIGLDYRTETHNALWLLNGDVAALDSEGTLHLLNATTGQLKRRIMLGSQLRGQPVISGDLIVLPLADRLAGVPVGLFMGDGGVDAADVALLDARNAIARGQMDDAHELVKTVLVEAPWKTDAWLLNGDLLYQQEETENSFAAYMRYLDMTGAEHIERTRDRQGQLLPPENIERPLEKQFGLIRRIRIGGDIQIPLVEVAGMIVAVNDIGSLATIAPDSLEVKRHTLAGSSGRFIGPMVQIAVESTGPPEMITISTNNAMATSPNRQRTHNQTDIPEQWLVQNKLDGPVIAFRNRQYIPLSGGNVRILTETNTVETYETHLENIETWSIRIVGDTPIGASKSRMLLLDENLCPRKWFPDWQDILAIAGDGKTIAVVAVPRADSSIKALRLQIFDNKTLEEINSTDLDNVWHLKQTQPVLQPMHDGYLLACSELIWLPAQKGASIRRVGGMGKSYADSFRYGYKYNSVLVRDDRMFVGSRDGCVYVFSIAQFCRMR